ncbi:MAG: dihydrofolate reductase [Jatrophihabitantaceae bacterium]
MIGLVWAQAANGVIGRDGALPWHLPEDLAHFRSLTAGATVVMGRRTWDSLPPRFRPLPGRRNLVLTRDPAWHAAGASAVHELGAALQGDVWVIGGADVYAAALPRADRVVRTELRASVDGDALAPELDGSWQLAASDPGEGWHESAAGFSYRIRTYARGSAPVR